jgi:hypothetical protein
MRHALAKIYLDRNPGQIEVVRLLLGHKDIKTTICIYLGGTESACRRSALRTVNSGNSLRRGRDGACKCVTIRPAFAFVALCRSPSGRLRTRPRGLPRIGETACSRKTARLHLGRLWQLEYCEGLQPVLTYVYHTGFLDPVARPQDRVTRDLVQAYIAHLQALNAPGGVASKIIQLARAIAVMAPTLDWRWLSRISSRLTRAAPPFRDDRARLVDCNE